MKKLSLRRTIVFAFFIGNMFSSVCAQQNSKTTAPESALTAGVKCRVLGYRWGFTATAAMQGRKTNPKWDFSIPPRCRGKAETEEGIRSGVYAASK